ncbi:MAG: hypothetical protein A3K19_21870 [Lentisphaerae bacterium RIFOXYB12_FULL_65_16]|nr:MAG: hypothetical protein A3K18_04380 [Lentisphaerae bacterium RIFOXYA12_64_32]OGV93906.1 MAG: hypothetical protein A3K19_21870 [Lentisphaerae bacterium RIFOXYB12_FULL_65_16]
MIIDVHTHYCRDMVRLVGSALDNGIDRICVSSLGLSYLTNPTPDQIRECNDQTLASMAQYPDAVVGFCFLNPLHEPDFSLAELHRCVKAGMRGIKLWVATVASDPRLDPIAREAIALDIPLLHHSFVKVTGNMPGESTPADIADLARRHPRLNLIMAHFTGNGQRGILEIQPYPNVFADSSGGYPCTGITEFTVRTLGPERILFGSDAPGRNYAVQFARVLGAVPEGPARNAILGDTAQRLLRL